MTARWSNPDHAVNLAERMRHVALHMLAGRRGDYESYWRIVAASLEPWTEGEWRQVERSGEGPRLEAAASDVKTDAERP